MPSTPKTFGAPSDSSGRPVMPATTEAATVATERARRSFFFSAIAHADYDALAALGTAPTILSGSKTCAERLNAAIELKAYSATIRQVQIVPLLFTQPNNLHRPMVRFTPATGELLLSPLLPSDELAAVTETGYPALLSAALFALAQEAEVVPVGLLDRICEVLEGEEGTGARKPGPC